MNYLLKNKEKPIFSKKIYTAILLFLILLLLELFFGDYIKTGLLILVNNTGLTRNYSFNKNFIFSSLKSKIDLIEENNNLKSELSLIKIQKSISSTTSEKNNVDIIEAKVVSKPPFSPYDSLVINYGDFSVYEGDDVFLGSFYIGKVINTWKGFAEVRLFSSGDYKKEAILERNNLSVILDGRGGGNFYIKLPKDFDVLEGDILKDGLLDDKVVAKVVKIVEQNQSSFKDVYLTYPFSIFELSKVYIIKDNK